LADSRRQANPPRRLPRWLKHEHHGFGEFNAVTKKDAGLVSVVITVYQDKSFGSSPSRPRLDSF
jgi:hypothetical protein